MAHHRSDPATDPVVLRIRRLALETSKTPGEIADLIVAGSDGGPPIAVAYQRVWRWTRRFRSERAQTGDDRTPAGMADRILSLLSAELERIERASAKPDLDRLDRIARTLRTLEPIRPKAEEKRASNLRQWLDDQQPEGLSEDERSSDLSEAQRDGVPHPTAKRSEPASPKG